MAYQGRFSQTRDTAEDISLTAEPREQEAPMAEPETEPIQVPHALQEQEPPAEVEAAADRAFPDGKSGTKQVSPNTPAGNGGRKKKKRKRKKANRTITLIFYTVYFVLVAAMIGGLFFLNSALEDWLVSFQASQPATRAEEIFQEHFADPDWITLYQMAGLSDTDYEGSEAFAAYMTEKVGSTELTYVESYAGLSGGHKYLLKLGDETLGYFTLVDQAAPGSGTAVWQLGQVRLARIRGEAITVQSVGNVTVYVNGVALTDAHTVRISTPVSEEYLPEGVRSPRIYTRYVDGLTIPPEVTASDADGNPVEVHLDAETGVYMVQAEENTISEEESDRALNTAKTYALHMVKKASAQELSTYFDLRSDACKAMLSSTPWTQDTISGHSWGEAVITGYWRCGDSLFCVDVELPLVVTRPDASVQEYQVDHTFLFEQNGGTWKCIGMTDADDNREDAVVRLTFQTGGTVIFTNMFDEDLSTLVLPTVTAPEGQIFTGWYRLDTSADGNSIYTRVFAPGDGSVISLPAGSRLEPMTLCALFEAQE